MTPQFYIFRDVYVILYVLHNMFDMNSHFQNAEFLHKDNFTSKDQPQQYFIHDFNGYVWDVKDRWMVVDVYRYHRLGWLGRTSWRPGREIFSGVFLPELLTGPQDNT